MKQFFLLLAISLAVITTNSFAQEASDQPTFVQKAAYFDKSSPLRDMPVILPGERDRSWKDGIIDNKSVKEQMRRESRNSPANATDGAVQQVYGTRSSRGPVIGIEGIGNVDGVVPPDTDGEVGPNHFFQMINLSFAIWDKDGNILYGPVDNSTLWNGFIGPWTGTNDGDPIVLYDEEADRWVATQFAVNTSNGTYWELIAVSETSDPTGSYYRYAFQFFAFNDYPKLSVWNDGYYATFNMFGSYTRVGVAAFERDEMLTGNPDAQMVYFDRGSGTFAMLPADFDGTPPPVGAPCYFMDINASTHEIYIYEFDVNWTTPGNSTFTLNSTMTPAIYSANVNGVPQPNTTQKLDDLAMLIMFRLQYRNFGTYETLVTNHTVSTSGRASIRWYEMRKTASDWSIYQQGTFAPDITERWTGSAAMNGNGDIALGYSASSADVYPSIRYTGRRAGDPLGQMTVQEIEVKAGLSSQTFINRWGDYSCLTVDPVDDTTFWFTNEYMKSSGWGTYITSFNLGPLMPPTANAGEDAVICQNDLYDAIGTVTSTSSVLWTTAGDGFFQSPTSLSTFYLRGNEDIENGQVYLTLTAQGFEQGMEASDSALLTLIKLPFIFAGPDTLLCLGESLLLDEAQAMDYDSLLWTTAGDGSFDNDTILIATYTPGADDISNGSVQLTLFGSGVAPCVDGSDDKIDVTIDECTGLDEITVDKIKLSVSPNPSQGVFKFTVNGFEQENLTLQIYNMQGQVLFTYRIGQLSGEYSNRIDMSSYPEGIYFINIQNDKISKTEKLVLY
ncbi:MAG: T9SS type A sorting domain-containing protein [Bacteroidota bacterium]|nr:T9SS type A sorting domain-containing protein [Bacteroidota bacterium]